VPWEMKQTKSQGREQIPDIRMMIYEGILWKREIPKQHKQTIYNLYFKLILTHTEHQNMDTYKERQQQNESKWA
jgi:hypothetical protein